MMYQLSEAGMAVLRALKLLGASRIPALSVAAGFDTTNPVYALKKCGYVEVLDVQIQAIRQGGKIYTITEKGLSAIRMVDNPPVRVPVDRADKEAPNLALPERVADETVKFIEIDGRKVKISYGLSYKHETLKLETDHSRYVSRPIKGIHAL